MKKLFITLFTTLLSFTLFTNVYAQDNKHINISDNVLNHFTSFELSELDYLEGDLDHIEEMYDINVYFIFDSITDEDIAKNTAIDFLSNKTLSKDDVVFLINLDGKSFYHAIGQNEDLLDDNFDSLVDIFDENESIPDLTLSLYQYVVNLYNCQTYEIKVPILDQKTRLYDGANKLSDAQEKQILAKLDEYSKLTGVDIIVVTSETLNGMANAQEYADDFYDYNGYAKDGILFLLTYSPKKWHVSTKGNARFLFTDYDIDEVFYDMKPYLSDDLAKAFDIYAEGVKDRVLFHKENGNQQYKEPATFGLLNVGIAAAIGLVASLVYIGILDSQLKSVRTDSFARNYVRPGSFYLTGFSDVFVTSHISKRKIERDSGSSSHGGGGSFSSSSSHTSSSGSSHGGHGGSW